MLMAIRYMAQGPLQIHIGSMCFKIKPSAILGS